MKCEKKCENCIHFEVCSYVSHLLPPCDFYAESPVRCKDCLHRSQHECPMYHEEEVEWDDDGYIESEVIEHDYTKDDGFCDRGERRADHE